MNFLNLKQRLRLALEEDNAFSDVTTQQIPGYKNKVLTARIVAKAAGVFCGEFLLRPVFSLLDPKVKVQTFACDGQKIRPGQILARIKGTARALMSAERTCLNLASQLSGISTLTQAFVRAVNNKEVQILDTRKTTPLWRDTEKFAVRCGGGVNHRMSLGDAILVKDNHLHYLRQAKLSPKNYYSRQTIPRMLRKKIKFIEVEAKTFADVWEGIKIGADIIMLDNMTIPQIKASLVFIRAARRALNSKKPFVEISGGVNLKNVRQFARLGIERISIGALTHSVPSLDLSMEVD
jgi:nicotinate-nucleotide pyrophosphorylase (carboxylating)